MVDPDRPGQYSRRTDRSRPSLADELPLCRYSRIQELPANTGNSMQNVECGGGRSKQF